LFTPDVFPNRARTYGQDSGKTRKNRAGQHDNNERENMFWCRLAGELLWTSKQKQLASFAQQTKIRRAFEGQESSHEYLSFQLKKCVHVGQTILDYSRFWPNKISQQIVMISE